MMKISKILTTAAALLLTGAVSAQNQEMDKFVDGLMSRMTLHEKIGQLNLQVAGDITTGQAQDSEVSGKIKAGEIGGVFNLKGVDKIKALQKLAVEKSRLGIPLLVGMDVIHGYETIFPHSVRAFMQLGPQRHRACSPNSRKGGHGRRHQLGVQPYGRHLHRCPLGPHI